MAIAELEHVASLSERILDEVERAVVGKREVLELVLMGFLADGHVLLEDYPGLAKTLLASSFAQVTDLRFQRIQFTPDLMPSDVTGSSIFNQRSGDFEFRPGPIFANLLLGDEINRAPPKTQAALLEAMQERQVDHRGRTRTRSTARSSSSPRRTRSSTRARTRCPEAQLDRFLLRIVDRLPGRATTSGRCSSGGSSARRTRSSSTPVVDRATLLEMQRAIEQVHVAESIGYYMVDLVAATRESARVQVGASPRGSLALLKLSRCRAALDGRDFVTPDDVKSVAVPALAHRLMLRPELWVQRVSSDDVVARGAGDRADAAGRRSPGD